MVAFSNHNDNEDHDYMAKIYKKLQQLIDDKAVMPFTSEGALETIPRRKLINWNVREKDGSYRVARETIERMNRRADAELGFSADAMKKVARGQKGRGSMPEAAKLAAQDSAIASGVAVVVTPKTKAKKAKVAPTAKPSAPPAPPIAPQPAPASPKLGGEDTHVILVFDESGSMARCEGEMNAQFNAIRTRLVAELPKAKVDILCFGTSLHWHPSVSAAAHMPTLLLGSNREGTSLYFATRDAVLKAISFGKPCLVYLITDGDATDSDRNGASSAVAAALATNRITFACVGPAAASTFFRNCGIPDNCVRKWDGVDKTDLNKVTAQAAQGVSNYAQARSAGKTKMDSFFVDVVANAITPERVKKELRDITSSLRVRKINKFEVMKDYVEKELKLTLVPGAGYYPLQKAEVLKQGRRIIVQVRGESQYYAGPAARKLLGLPEDRDVKVEPKNLGELVVYFQSASPTRKLLPGTLFLYDESHVPGATAPTWSYADNAKKGA